MKNKYFAGKDYKTIKEKNDILAKYDSLQKAKIEFLNDMYTTESTLKSFWSIYNTHIRQHELLLNKDVMFFSDTEIDELMANRFRYAKPTKSNIIHFINIYKRWGVDRGDINGNSVQALNREEVIKDIPKVLSNRLWGLGEFYNLLVDIQLKSKMQYAITLLLARYGIMGKKLVNMLNLRWEDINYENKKVRIIENGQLINTIDVDDRFLEWIDKYKASFGDDDTDYGYVLKKTNRVKDSDLRENYNTINTRVYKVSQDLGIPRIAFTDLFRSRQIDMLLQIRETRRLFSDDIDWVIESFYPHIEKGTTIFVGRSAVLRDYYETLTGDIVIRKSTQGSLYGELADDKAKEAVLEIRKKINFEEFINGENQFVVDEDGVIIEDSTIKEVSIDSDLVDKELVEK